MDERLVPNPWHTILKRLLAEAEGSAHEVRLAYQPAVQAMRSGKVWTGPTATTWSDELEERHHRLATLARHVADAIEEELRRHPAMVTQAEADAIHRELAGRI